MLSANLNFLRFTLGKDPFREKNRKIFYEQYVFVGDEHVQKLQWLKNVIKECYLEGIRN